MLNIVLINPRIPQNTGTIGWLCVALNASLHLIKPYGFEISEKKLRRAGLDYWKDLKLFEYDSFDDFQEKYQIDDRHFFCTTKTTQPYFCTKYNIGDFLYFGREDAGIDEDLLNNYKKQNITIPMNDKARSLNLANAVSIISYEVLRQNYKQYKL